ncbi:MAG: hypothetical protein U0996_04915 [Planctomycetaceae bacterium]
MIVGTAYTQMYPNPNSLSWERDLEVVALVGLWFLYLVISVGGAFLLLRSCNPNIRGIGTILAALPSVIVCGGFISLVIN